MSYDFSKTLKETQKIRSKYPERIPVYIKRSKDCIFPDIDKNKFLVPLDITLGTFVSVIRKRINLAPEKALFVFINNVLPPLTSLMSKLYEDLRDPDGFLYIYYNGESTFGYILS